MSRSVRLPLTARRPVLGAACAAAAACATRGANSGAAPATATLAGTVRDTAGVAVRGATVIVASSDTARPRLGATTDAAGAFALPGVPPGRYLARVRQIGFAEDQRPVILRPGRVDTLAFVLHPLVAALEEVCTANYVEGLAVAVRAAPGGPPLDSAAVVVRSGAYVEVRPARRRDGGGPLHASAAGEREGVYEVAVSAPGYRPWRRAGVTVARDRCHVFTTHVDVELAPRAGSAVRSRGARRGPT